MKQRRFLNAMYGFSLLELMITLGLITIVLFIAIPFTHSFGNKHLLNTRVKMIEAVISYSQNQALTLGRAVALAPLSGDNWSSGMRLYVDTHANHRYQAGDRVLREWHFGGGKLSISWQGFLSDSYLVFSDRLAQSVLNGRFILTNHSGEVMKQLVINSLGRVRVV